MAPPHTHMWATVDFGIAEGRPVVRQQCACGSERQVRAFDRTWHPPEDILQGADGGTPHPIARSRGRASEG